MSMLGSLSHKPASFSETLIPLCMHINGNTKQETITGLIVHLKVQADLLLLFAYPALCFDTLGKKYFKKNVIHKVSLSLQYDDGFAFSVLSSTQLYQRAAFTEEATSIIKGMCLSCPYRILWPDWSGIATLDHNLDVRSVLTYHLSQQSNLSLERSEEILWKIPLNKRLSFVRSMYFPYCAPSPFVLHCVKELWLRQPICSTKGSRNA